MPWITFHDKQLYIPFEMCIIILTISFIGLTMAGKDISPNDRVGPMKDITKIIFASFVFPGLPELQ